MKSRTETKENSMTEKTEKRSNGLTKQMGREYLTERGLDWERIDAEYLAAATQYELVRGEASAAVSKKGGTPGEQRAAADVAWAAYVKAGGADDGPDGVEKL
jgi:hypothetical protein